MVKCRFDVQLALLYDIYDEDPLEPSSNSLNYRAT